MIETPLFGRFVGEGKRLVFDSPAIYRYFVQGTGVVGGLGLLYGLGANLGAYEVMNFYPQWWLMVGTMVLGAAVLAALSLQSISFDLREKSYRRRQGPGFLPKTYAGRLQDLDAVVLIAEPNDRVLRGGVTYHLILHWKGESLPIMILQQDTRVLRTGEPLNFAGQQLLAQGIRYAKALELPFYDNSHFPSKNPITIWQR